MKTAVACVAILLLAVLATAGVTHGFRVFTQEGARRQWVEETRPPLMAVNLVDQHHATFELKRAVGGSGKVWLIDFIYTRCNAICRAQGTDFQRLQRAIVTHGLQGKVHLLSISFDPAHDSPDTLARHAARYEADPAVWQFATVRDPRSLPAVLSFFGITVIPDEWGGFQHNSAYQVVSPQARLVGILDREMDALTPVLRLVDDIRA